MSKATSNRRLRIPVRLVDGVWECSFGGKPPVKQDSAAELVVDRMAISDKSFLEMMERRARHKVLDEGTPLLIALSVRQESPPPENLRSFLKSFDDMRGAIATEFLDDWNPGTICFVEVTLAGPNDRQSRLFKTDQGGLWLMTHGLEAIGLSSTTIRLPQEITGEPVASLNHAYTTLSEKFETWRISHTGNVYTRVLYQERNGKWYPLDLLRNKALGKQEQEIAKGLWESFLSKMTLTDRRK